MHGYFLHNAKEFFVSAVSPFRDDAEFSRVVDVVGGGKFFNFPDCRLTIDLDKLQIGQFDSRVRKSVEKGNAFRPMTISKDAKNKSVLLVQVPSFEMRENSKTVAGWEIIPEDPQKRKDRRDKSVKQEEKTQDTERKPKDKGTKGKSTNPAKSAKSDPSPKEKKRKTEADAIDSSVEDLTKRLLALNEPRESISSKKKAVQGWADDISAKIDIDRVEYARGEVRDFVSGGRKRASYRQGFRLDLYEGGAQCGRRDRHSNRFKFV